MIVDVRYFLGSDNDKISFWSNDNFLDHSMLRLRFSELKKDLEETVGFSKNKYKHLEPNQVELINNWFDRKRKELSEFYSLGGDVVIIADMNPTMVYPAYKSEFDYGHHRIDFLNFFSLDKFNFECEPLEGITFTADSSIREITSKAHSSYHFTIKTEENLKVLATTVKTPRIISFLSKIEKGRLLMLPDLMYNLISTPDLHKWFHSEITNILSSVSDNLEEISLSSPNWVKNIELKGQQQIINELSLLQEQKRQLELQIGMQEKLSLKYEILKSILFTSGKHLEKGIEVTMQHLGMDYIVPSGSETDLIIHKNDHYIAVEIKGVTGSASLKNSRQLEHWVSKTALKYDSEDVKGLLLINCYHHLPLVERTDIIFPPNVIEFSEARKHCLLTTRDLFNMIRDFDSGKLSKSQILDLILETNGVLKYD